MSTDTMIFLAGFSFEVGLIGLDEYEERIEIALWLDDDSDTRSDPRTPTVEVSERCGEEQSFESILDSSSRASIPSNPLEPRILELIALKVWYFTGSDPDSYPSVPHGHYQNANRPWPKLNPYIGRVFSAKHVEDQGARLSKKEMRDLWTDNGFRDHCRKQIMWYMQEHSYYRFPVKNPMRLPRR
ncbi:MAG: hypothetical protein NTY50_08950 [Methylobacter sp.]|nr:hypothetical protein [Methylobacter sp.]